MHQGQLTRAAVELAKDWRTDRMLRKLEALLAVADSEASLIITGNGDVIQPEDDLIAIGSGGPFAQSAAKALLLSVLVAPLPSLRPRHFLITPRWMRALLSSKA